MIWLIKGLLLGLAAGFSPGPLLVLVISETLKGGPSAGIKVSLAPLITDLPIVILSLFLVGLSSSSEKLLGIIAILGAVYVIYLGIENLRSGAFKAEADSSSQPLLKGVLTNFLSPHPWLFWFTVGAPIFILAGADSRTASWAFAGGFYLVLIGSKLLIVLLVLSFRGFLAGRPYLYLVRFLGLLLIILALVLLREGLELSGVF